MGKAWRGAGRREGDALVGRLLRAQTAGLPGGQAGAGKGISLQPGPSAGSSGLLGPVEARCLWFLKDLTCSQRALSGAGALEDSR